MEGGGYEADSERSHGSINYGSLNDLTESPEQHHDNADSLENFIQLSNIPRVTIHSRTRVSIFNLQMEGKYIVEDFSSFINDDVLYTLIAVRIEAMFCDIDNDRDFVTFVDYKGYHCSIKVGDVIALVNFKVDRFFYHQFPKYKNYCLIYGDYKIIPTEQSKIMKLANAVARGFSLYPLIPTIQTLTYDRTRRRLIVDNILRSTELTRIVFQPDLPEAHDIKGVIRY
ncbi:hypothetical protein R6Q57_027099 [Mikania cordata]